MFASAQTPADLTPVQFTSDIKSGLEAIRRLLLQSPNQFSLVTAGAALEQVASSLIALNSALLAAPAVSPSLQQDLLEMQSLSVRVQSLYRQASSFYGGLAAESIKNGSWDAASYNPDGDWANPATQQGQRIATEG